jgi:hypothetical protein
MQCLEYQKLVEFGELVRVDELATSFETTKIKSKRSEVIQFAVISTSIFQQYRPGTHIKLFVCFK